MVEAQVLPSPAPTGLASTHIRGLDGIRALAVMAVVAYHLDLPWMRGGFLGVDIFMVLSGYLITRLVLREADRTGRVDVAAFWVRRARRLLPASLAIIVVTTVVARVLFRTDQLGTVRGDSLAATYYVANWRFVLADASYFDLFAEVSPFRHLWSLAIEEQFYLVWPLVALACAGRRTALLVGTLICAGASAVAMAVLADPADPSRAYYGTDTRVQTLLIGCALALLLHGRSNERLERSAPAVAAGALVALVVMLAIVDDEALFMYRGGFTLVAIIAAVAVGAVVIAQGSAVTDALEHSAFTAIGRGSYSIYLVHWPVIVFMSEARVGFGGVPLIGLHLAVTAAGAYFSYRFIESPIRRRDVTPRFALLAVTASASTVTVTILLLTAAATPPADFFSADGAVTANSVALQPLDAGDESSASTSVGGDPAAPLSFLVLGDSVAASLSDGLLAWSAQRGVPVAVAPVSGCGLLPGVTLDGTSRLPYEPSRGCEASVLAASEQALRQVRPSVVVWVSVWDAVARQVDGEEVDPAKAESREALSRLVEEQISRFRVAGAMVVLVTNPPTGASAAGPAPSADSQRHSLGYNDVLRSIALANDDVLLVELANEVCPNGPPCRGDDEMGRSYRPTDGIHYEGEPSVQIAAWILDEAFRQVEAAG